MDDTIVTFFMIVTDFDAVVADYAIRAFAKLGQMPFQLVVYPNSLSEASKNRYFAAWKSYPFVRIWEDAQPDIDVSSRNPSLAGPYEHCSSIWNRELRRIASPYIATVDADFEILNPRFVGAMLARLAASPNLIAISSDYSPTIERHLDPYSGTMMRLNQRWHTWFIIYRKKAFECPVSLGMHREQIPQSEAVDFWDSAGWFQSMLQRRYGCDLEAVDTAFRNDFIHYGAFSKNTRVNSNNVGLFRSAAIWKKRGFFARGDMIGRLWGFLLGVIFFHHHDRGKFIAGYKAEWPDGVDTYP